jgi:ribonuclease P protein component
VWLLGKSFAHPLLILLKHPNALKKSRFGIVAGKSVGNAVKRNRCKRLIRETLRQKLPAIPPGWDIILLARKPLVVATYLEIQSALETLLSRADLIEKKNVN